MRASDLCCLSIVTTIVTQAHAFPHWRRDLNSLSNGLSFGTDSTSPTAGDGAAVEFGIRNGSATDGAAVASTPSDDFLFTCYGAQSLPHIFPETCRPNFLYLLHHWPDHRIFFHKKSRVAPEPCGIELRPYRPGETLNTTNREITTMSHRILNACARWGKGGYYNPTERAGNVWSVSVSAVFIGPFLGVGAANGSAAGIGLTATSTEDVRVQDGAAPSLTGSAGDLGAFSKRRRFLNDRG